MSSGPPPLSPERRQALSRLLQRAGGRARHPHQAVAGDVRPVSFAQERLWVLDQLRPGNPAYNVPSAHRLTGRLHADALQTALDQVVRRHETLRTTFDSLEGRPVQVVAPELHVPIRLHDLGHVEPRRRDVEALRLLEAEAGMPFDLARGPLLRHTLVRLGPDDHLLLLTLHHAVADGWSLGVLNHELGALYAAALDGRPSPLPELAVQYAELARRQQDWLRTEAVESQLAYWRRQLAGAPQLLELPADRIRPPLQSFRGGSERLDLDAELSASVQRLAGRQRATPFMALLAAFGALLSRLVGRADLLVGTPVAGRTSTDAERLIGCFLNSLVLRLDHSGRPGFRELLDRTRDVVLAALDHQDLPFERLVEELQPERDLSRTPLFQVFFNHTTAPAALELQGLAVAPCEVHTGTAKFDLTLYVQQQGPRIGLVANYAADLFEAERIQELLRQYTHLLEQAVAAPDRPVARISLVTPRARRLLPDPTARLDAGWRGSLPALLRAQAERAPEAPAVAADGVAWTYADLVLAAGRLGRALAEAGVGRGDVVAIHARRRPELVLALVGSLWAGAAFTILDPGHPPARLAEQAGACHPAAWMELTGQARLHPGLEAVAAACRLRLRLPEDAAALAALPPVPAAGIGPDELAYVAFTSGSTGMPRGVLGRHGPLTHFLPWLEREFGLGGDRFSLLSGLAHDPLHRDVFTPLCTGGEILCPPPGALAAGALPAWLAAAGVTVAHLTPALGQVLCEPAPQVAAGCLPALRLAFFVGDVLTRRDVARLKRLAPAITVVNYYGSTETQRAVGYHVVRDVAGREVVPLGRGIEDVQLLVLNAAGDLAGVAEPGEVWVRSPHLARGYLDDEGLTAERFRPNPFTAAAGDRLYRTGDLGRYLPDGDVEPLGRADRQVKVAGHRVEPGEVEAALGRHPAVREATVSLRGGRLLAHVVAAAPVADRELRAFLDERLPEPMVPAAFVRVPELPLTPNGKVDVERLPDPAEAARPDLDREPPADELEADLAAIWQQVLGPRPVDRRSTVFDLGGGSLELVRVHARLQERYGIAIPVVDLFRHSSLAAMARRLRDGARG